jgi:predicted outer membrane repeat protein
MQPTFGIRPAILSFVAWFAAVPCADAAVLFVDATASPGGNGLAWSTAFRRLQDALSLAQSDSQFDEIWVAAGVYRPHNSNRDASFVLVSGVSLLGGFAGGETSADQRDPQANPTILSGDLSGNDQPNFGQRGDNSRHVVTGTDLVGTVIDGFTIRGGNHDLPGSLLLGGAGMFVTSTPAGFPSDVAVRQCAFVDNTAGITFTDLGNLGGGLLLRAVDGVIEDCRFEGNRAVNGGALGLYHANTADVDMDMTVSITRCEFIANTSPAQTGGAIWSTIGRSVTGTNTGILEARDCVFDGNDAEYYGAWLDNNATHFVVSGCTFQNNSSRVHGGAFAHIQTGGPDVEPFLVTDCRFLSNHTDGAGGGIWVGAADGIVRNCLFRANTALLQGGGIRSGTYFTTFGAQDLQVDNCVFDSNTGLETGGIWCMDTPLLRVNNCTFVHNVSTFEPAAGIRTAGFITDVDNSIFFGNQGPQPLSETTTIRHALGGSLSVNFCLIEGFQGALGGVGNFDANPLFVDELGPDAVAGTGDENLRLGAGSPAIDAGINAAVPVDVTVDHEGNGRFVDDPSVVDTGSGTPPLVDLGAYEFQAAPATAVLGVDAPAGALRLAALPNPATSSGVLVFELPAADRVDLRLFDVRGRLAATLLDGALVAAGRHAVPWTARDRAADALGPGVYFAKLVAGTEERTAKLVIVD